MKFLLVLPVIVALVSCGSAPPIVRVSESSPHFGTSPVIASHNYPDKDVYRVYQRGGSTFVPISSILSAAEERARAFAHERKRNMVILGSRVATPPYVFGNFPRAEVIFALTDKETAPKAGE